MKKTILILILASFAAASCNYLEDVLSLTPESQLTPDA